MFLYEYNFSIVMGYYNRREQVSNTLRMFEKYYGPYNFEVIIVDDNSSPEHRLDDLVNLYTFPVKYIKISSSEKGDRVNPCIPFNRGISCAKGRIVVLQNPECYHSSDLLSTIEKTLTQKNYITFSCYMTANTEVASYLISNPSLVNDRGFNIRNIYQGKMAGGVPWSNHPTFRPSNYHFCSAILNDNIKLLGGFDSRFACGHSYDDDELLLSIKSNLRIDVVCLPPSAGFVIHQWHPRDVGLSHMRREHLVVRNQHLMDSLKHAHNVSDFKYPKLLHLHFPRLDLLDVSTILSFNRFHKAWKINIYRLGKCLGNDTLYSELSSIPNVNIHIIGVSSGYTNASGELSNTFPYYIMDRFGGVWSEPDIIYVGSIENYCSSMSDHDAILHRGEGEQSTGLMIARKGADTIGKSKTLRADNSNARVGEDMHNTSPARSSELSIKDTQLYTPFSREDVWKIFGMDGKNNFSYEGTDTFGIKWFRDSDEAMQYRKEFNQELSLTGSCLMKTLLLSYFK